MMAMQDFDVEQPSVGLPNALNLLRTRTFAGRDPENLVTALVDGAGMVERITFAATASARRPQTLAAAVLSAIADGQTKGIEALMDLAEARDAAGWNPPTPVEGIVGGPVDGTDSGDQPQGGSE